MSPARTDVSRSCTHHTEAGRRAPSIAGCRALQTLAVYRDVRGRRRSIATCEGAAGSRLVLDRASAHGDARLVAHLAADEPPANALLVCEHYLADPTRGRCRMLRAADLEGGPLGAALPPPSQGPLVDAGGGVYSLERRPRGRLAPELRWCRCHVVVSLREVIGALESYEPARSMTVAALERVERRGASRAVAASALRSELARVDASRIVLNRGLREAVLRAMTTEGLSMNEIAIRCGRVKRDGHGHTTGETSWLARRLGLAPESGQSRPSPWIHSEVLALVARRGLGIDPHEVELG